MNTPPVAPGEAAPHGETAPDETPAPGAAAASAGVPAPGMSAPTGVAAPGVTAPAGMSAEVALAAVTEIIDAVVGGLDLRAQSGDAVLATAARVERVGRWVDALRVAAAAEIADQSRPELGADGLATQRGCRTANELLQRVTRVSGATAARCTES